MTVKISRQILYQAKPSDRLEIAAHYQWDNPIHRKLYDEKLAYLKDLFEKRQVLTLIVMEFIFSNKEKWAGAEIVEGYYQEAIPPVELNLAAKPKKATA